MRMSRGTSLFLTAFGVWSWIIWITFARNLWNSDNSWNSDGSPTSFFVVHLLLAVTSFVLGTIIGVIGWRGLRASRNRGEAEGAAERTTKS
ncbi:SCO4848 family membrane protein [Saccharomonospora viridis]|jgi:hypothetical protein|uniref:Uncharacterized protein n=2 Tax=Saccharomonospora viridis TaxID=1852 RepID=C7MUP4_SACVD|nr:hypothetical protein [Saccharomonospora viridis]ACU95607.1 hypothetical protein Svir_05330 [Saccharomonospora viridis DSM 43017]KHF45241.1 membrane protein [Saccharomonospora viridis]SFP09274.1 hypothetical protein SAMN02982918_1209 [Saccharomonospora viridis]